MISLYPVLIYPQQDILYTKRMQTQPPLYFIPIPTQTYKILSVLDGRKAFTIQPGTNNLIIQDYTGSPSQNFNVYINDKTYAFVSQQKALRVQNQNKNDGAAVQADPGQFPSSYFQIVPVTKGEWANKACHIKTFAGKSLDIKGAVANQNTQICQWNFHGANNQVWVITPSDQPIQPVQPIQPIQPVQPQPQQSQILNQSTNNEVPALFVANPDTLYKVVSVLNTAKSFSIDIPTNKLQVGTYKGEFNQKFKIFAEQNKFAFVSALNNWGLCIYKDKKEKMGEPVLDGGVHPSSWFQLVRVTQGKWANKAYHIKTHGVNQALDICGGKCEDGTQIVQYDIHGGENQIWLIVPSSQDMTVPPQNQSIPPPQPQVVSQPEVAANFIGTPNTVFRVVSVLEKTKAFTVDQVTSKISLKPFTGDVSQKFAVFTQNNKFAFVNVAKQAGLCVFQDNKANNADVVVDGGKHPSSWFEVTRNTQGKWINRAYSLKTHAGKVIDASGPTLVQNDFNGSENQLWLIVPADQPLPQVNPINPTQPQPQSQTQGTTFSWANNLANVIQNFGSKAPQVVPGQAPLPIPFIFEPSALIQANTNIAVNAAVFTPFQNYIIYAAHSDGLKAIDVSQASSSFGNLILYSFHGAPNQRFIFEQEGNLYRIKSISNGKYVRVTNDDEHDGMWIRTDEKGSKSELWSITPSNDAQYAGKKAYHIRSVLGKALEVAGGQLADESKIQQGTFHGKNGQTWIIKEI